MCAPSSKSDDPYNLFHDQEITSSISTALISQIRLVGFYQIYIKVILNIPNLALTFGIENITGITIVIYRNINNLYCTIYFHFNIQRKSGSSTIFNPKKRIMVIFDGLSIVIYIFAKNKIWLDLMVLIQVLYIFY